MLDLGVECVANSMFVDRYRPYLVPQEIGYDKLINAVARFFFIVNKTVSICSLLSECPPGVFIFLAFLSQCGHTDC